MADDDDNYIEIEDDEEEGGDKEVWLIIKNDILFNFIYIL